MRLFGRKAVARAIVGMIPVAAAVVLMAEGNLTVRFRDDCDPKTFNAAIGPGTCVGGGDTTFQEFLNEFNKKHSVEAWKFDPDEAKTDGGTVVNLRNRGGETHSFTQVAKFGGGFRSEEHTSELQSHV